MKQTHSRSVEPRPFAASGPDLQALATRILATLGQSRKVTFGAEVREPRRTLSGDSVAELAEVIAEAQRPKTVDLTFQVTGDALSDSRYLSLEFSRHRSSFHASSGDETWAAGVMDLVSHFARERRRWYWWARTPWGGLPIVVLVAALPFPFWVLFPFTGQLTVVLGAALAFALGYYYTRLFPSFTLLTGKESFLRRHAPEITAAAALLSALAAVASLLR